MKIPKCLTTNKMVNKSLKILSCKTSKYNFMSCYSTLVAHYHRLKLLCACDYGKIATDMAVEKVVAIRTWL